MRSPGTTALLLSTTAALFGAGCLLDSGAFEAAGAGASSATGGQGGTGGTTTTMGGSGPGGSGGAGGQTSTTSSGTTTVPIYCDSADDCNDGNECTADACDINTNSCQFFIKAGKEIDESDKDCVKIQCNSDGTGTVVADTNDKPTPDQNVCTVESCSGTTPVSEPRPDGTYPLGECGEIKCASGQPVGGIVDNTNKCASKDNSQNDCLAPACKSTACTTQYVTAPAGYSCKKSNGDPGQCDGNGSAQNSCK